MTRRGIGALFVVYLGLLTWIVLWKLQLPWIGGVDRVIKLVPFIASGGLGSSRPAEVLLNLLIFVPFGGYLRLLAPRWRWWGPVAVAAGTSLGFETTQFLLAIGSSDVTDVIVNAAGASLGFVLAQRVRADGTMLRVGVAGTAAALLACALFFAAPVATAPLRSAPAGPGSGSGIAIEGGEQARH